MPGINSFTKLMLHMNGADTSTTFTDDSGTSKTATPSGNAQIDTAQSKFGGASGLFDGTGDYVTVANHADFNFSASNFTIDGWFRLNATTGLMTPFQGTTDYTYGILFRGDLDDTIRLYLSSNNSSNDTANGVTGTATFTTGAWYHIALTW